MNGDRLVASGDDGDGDAKDIEKTGRDKNEEGIEVWLSDPVKSCQSIMKL